MAAFDQRLSHPENISQTEFALAHAGAAEIFAKCSGCFQYSHIGISVAPECVMLNRIEMDRLVPTTVMLPIGNLIARQTLKTEHQRALDRGFGDRTSFAIFPNNLGRSNQQSLQ